MIQLEELLNLNYYQMTTYTGWSGGMRFLIRREQPENEEDEPFFHVFAWPGPYIFDLTDDDKKIDAVFPFSNEGLKQITDWLNSQLTEHAGLWPENKVAGVW